MSDKVYNYDSTNTNTKVYDINDWITNADATNCPILGCILLQSDCATALPSSPIPYISLITVDSTSPFAIRLAPTDTNGYANY